MLSRAKPQLVAPGGSFDKIKLAFRYGADAVYVGGTHFGLRKSADNLTENQLKRMIAHANELGKKLYITLNSFSHNDDIQRLPDYLHLLEKLQPHALIIADAGVFSTAKAHTSIPLHISTQASVTNAIAAKFWKNQGAKRIVLARECSISESQKIREEVQVEVEIFIHGAMCSSYSGKCVISNYTSGRDSNRGGCIQSCRHSYKLTDTQTEASQEGFVMNAKDLMAAKLIPQIIEAGIDALKIEGRMKSHLYLASAVSAYRDLLDQVPDPQIQRLEEASNRGFSEGSLLSPAQGQSINYQWNGQVGKGKYLGLLHTVKEGRGFLEVKSKFKLGDRVSFRLPKGQAFDWQVEDLRDTEGIALTEALPNHIVHIPLDEASLAQSAVLISTEGQ